MQNRIPPPLILLVFGVAMWLLARSAYGYSVPIPAARMIAGGFALVGVIVIVMAIQQFRTAQTTVNPLQPDSATSLVATGIFAHSRNPMYLGLLLILTGWAIGLQSAANLVLLGVFVMAITKLQIKPEEVALERVFGQDYLAYCERVRRWI